MEAADKAYYADLAGKSYEPGWARRQPAMWPTPQPKFKPAVWRFSEARAALAAAGSFVSTEQAERRNLILVNPIEGNYYATSRNLVCAYQMVKPGDKARSHRHSAAALRLVMEAEPGAYTVVDGVRIDMAPGDVVLTPPFCWHGHGNDGAAEAYWIDFLDVPLVQHLEAMFFEPHPDGYERIARQDPASPFRIPSAAALGAGSGPARVDVAPGVMATIGLQLIRQPAGSRLEEGRSTANSIYGVVNGRVRVVVDGALDKTLSRGDIIAVPCWYRHRLEAEQDTVLLRVSDQPLMALAGLLRHEAS